MITSINPATEQVCGSIDEYSEQEIEQVVLLARRNKEWATKPIEERVILIKKFAYILEKHKEALAKIMAEEIGKPLKAGRQEIDIAKRRVESFCDFVPECIADEKIFEDENEKNTIVYEQRGTVVVISPWNAPVFVSLANIMPSLLCGNNVIWKPSEYASLTGLRLNEVFNVLKEEGFPKEAFQIVIGGKEAGRKLTESDIDFISLTGSVRAGKEVARSSADKLHSFILELGGKDPTIVLDDADLDRAAFEIVKSSTMYSGQVCFGVERVYCHEKVFEELIGKCIEEAKKVKVGNPLHESTDIGPLSIKFQIEKYLAHIDDALQNGAVLVYGGRRMQEKGYFVEPGVIVNVNHEMKIMREETFGPITPIMKFSSAEEAIALANDTEYGLTASIWTSDIKKGEDIARKIQAGTVEINRHGMSKIMCPWGGYKNSGIGRIYSKEGIRNFCNVKHIWTIKK